MPKAKVSANVPADLTFQDEENVPSRAGRKTNIPQALLDAVQTERPKSITFGSEDEADAFRSLVRQAAGLLGRRNQQVWGAKTALDGLSDGRYKVTFQGVYKGEAESE